ncbi:hypothetical protein LTR53_006483 [Teratosphaeriaceae sp. CCFEE 6253]|nr:hypothetical protein LTR53_006483 [Teratosphaeriaceae sp. CCFEE 6253]
MLSRGSLSTLSSAERQLLRQQWRQSGKCVRCFHNSIRQRAGEGNDNGTPYNKPQRGPTRHQRSAQVSEEIRALNRGGPTSGPSTSASEDYGVGPQSLHQSDNPGRMGETMQLEREGPYGQGAARATRGIEEDEQSDVNVSSHVRGARTLGGKTEEPVEGGAAVLGGDGGVKDLAAAEQADSQVEAAEQRETSSDTPAPSDPTKSSPPQKRSRLPTPGIPFHPEQPTIDTLTRSGTKSSTIAAGNFAGVLADRLHAIASAGHLPGASASASASTVTLRTHQLLRGQLMQLHSAEDRAAVVAKANGIVNLDAHLTSQQRANMPSKKATEPRGAKDTGDTPKQAPRDGKPKAEPRAPFAPLPPGVQASLINAMVKGLYDTDGVLGTGITTEAGEERMPKYKQPVLNSVARQVRLNGSFASADAERIVQKVRSLLPVGVAPRAGVKKAVAAAAG